MSMFIFVVLIVVGIGAQTLRQAQENSITVVIEFSEDKQ